MRLEGLLKTWMTLASPTRFWAMGAPICKLWGLAVCRVSYTCYFHIVLRHEITLETPTFGFYSILIPISVTSLMMEPTVFGVHSLLS